MKFKIDSIALVKINHIFKIKVTKILKNYIEGQVLPQKTKCEFTPDTIIKILKY